MEYTRTPNGFLLKLHINEKVNESLQLFSKKEKIPSGFISGLGALKNSELGFYHLSEKKYDRKLFEGEMELVSLTGNISWLEDQVIIHTHVALGDHHFHLHGGHLFEALCAVTVELNITCFQEKIYRKMEPDIGLNLLQLNHCQIH